MNYSSFQLKIPPLPTITEQVILKPQKDSPYLFFLKSHLIFLMYFEILNAYQVSKNTVICLELQSMSSKYAIIFQTSIFPLSDKITTSQLVRTSICQKHFAKQRNPLKSSQWTSKYWKHINIHNMSISSFYFFSV